MESASKLGGFNLWQTWISQFKGCFWKAALKTPRSSCSGIFNCHRYDSVRVHRGRCVLLQFPALTFLLEMRRKQILLFLHSDNKAGLVCASVVLCLDEILFGSQISAFNHLVRLNSWKWWECSCNVVIVQILWPFVLIGTLKKQELHAVWQEYYLKNDLFFVLILLGSKTDQPLTPTTPCSLTAPPPHMHNPFFMSVLHNNILHSSSPPLCGTGSAHVWRCWD